jgi:hypothetical protein
MIRKCIAALMLTISVSATQAQYFPSNEIETTFDRNRDYLVAYLYGVQDMIDARRDIHRNQFCISNTTLEDMTVVFTHELRTVRVDPLVSTAEYFFRFLQTKYRCLLNINPNNDDFSMKVQDVIDLNGRAPLLVNAYVSGLDDMHMVLQRQSNAYVICAPDVSIIRPHHLAALFIIQSEEHGLQQDNAAVSFINIMSYNFPCRQRNQRR